MNLVCLAGLALAAWLAVRGRRTAESAGATGPLRAALDSRWIVWVLAAATAAIVWWYWGLLHPLPVVQDEFAYVLQARIFASGRWTAPSPPLPQFFEQAHVLVVPALAAKYPPGYSFVLAVGALVRWLPLVPLLLAGATAALLFVLARRAAGGAIALLTWVLWLSSPMVQRFAAGYYSESLTTVCWLAGWLALLEWRSTGRTRWLLVLALVTGLGAISRPLTMLAYAVPIGVVVLGDTFRSGRWRPLLAAMGTGMLVLAILPLWSARTTGHWNVSPVALYTRQYMPWDVPGFGYNATAPERAVPADLVALGRLFEPMHRLHLPVTMPVILELRVGFLLRNVWGAATAVLMPLAVLGLCALGGEALFAAASAVLLVLAYLVYAAAPAWTLYYYEIVPVIAFVTAVGVGVVASAARGGVDWRARLRGWGRPSLVPAVAAAVLCFAVPGIRTARFARSSHRGEVAYRTEFARILGTLHQPAVLFVRYAPDHSPHTSLVRNSPDLANDPVWVVYDRGAAENARLLALVPRRATYLYDEVRRGIFPYDVRNPANR